MTHLWIARDASGFCREGALGGGEVPLRPDATQPDGPPPLSATTRATWEAAGYTIAYEPATAWTDAPAPAPAAQPTLFGGG